MSITKKGCFETVFFCAIFLILQTNKFSREDFKPPNTGGFLIHNIGIWLLNTNFNNV